MSSDASKTSAACPSCRSRFVITDQMLGKKAKCPKCGQPFIIELANHTPAPREAARQTAPITRPVAAPAVTPPLPPPPVVEAAVTAPTVSVTPPSSPPTKKSMLPWWALTVGVPLLTLAFGYFVGREHLKYQMRSAFADIGKNLAEGMRGIGPPTPPGPHAVDEPGRPTPQVPKIAMGETHDAGQFTVQVVGAKVGPVRLRDFRDDSFDSDSPYLAVAILFRNKDERKSLRFHSRRRSP